MDIIVNAVGLPGPTTNQGIAAKGNSASEKNYNQDAYPKKAALQVLDAMWELYQRGVTQIVLPPHQRPCTRLLKSLGFTVNDMARIAKEEPNLLPIIYSGNHVFAANAATVTKKGNKTHISIANMHANPHRGASEGKDNFEIFQQIFRGPNFIVHEPLPSHTTWGDEGEANHLQLGKLNVFVYGKETLHDGKFEDTFPLARQSLEASRAIARRHQLNDNEVIFVQQTNHSIERGAFHADVVSVCANTKNQTVLLIHQDAIGFNDKKKIVEAFNKLTPERELVIINVNLMDLTIEEAVETYLFNSRLDVLPDGSILMVAPEETKIHPRASALVQKIINDSANPINSVCYVDVKESMRNGGGPACLRLPIPMSEDDLKRIKLGRANVLFTEELYNELKEAVNKYYPERIRPQDLSNPKLAKHATQALEEIQEIMKVRIIERQPSRSVE